VLNYDDMKVCACLRSRAYFASNRFWLTIMSIYSQSGRFNSILVVAGTFLTCEDYGICIQALCTCVDYWIFLSNNCTSILQMKSVPPEPARYAHSKELIVPPHRRKSWPSQSQTDKHRTLFSGSLVIPIELSKLFPCLTTLTTSRLGSLAPGIPFHLTALMKV